ncbi:Pentatricopeptide repeat-containing protein [Acorus gramineus]|uniref:Pentatricopeptide repeat-containing protein n=1 Tax=Acorus gramineus TaxID=55184 RepID=A0AAV9B186_ACOGR|nr:Pentatricopeptide repeat-containing protein [Acorus gramineus]
MPTSPSTTTNHHHPLSLLPNHCHNMRDLRILHTHLIKSGLSAYSAAANPLLTFCAISPFGDIRYASLIFSRIENPNHYAFNTLIRGLSKSPNPSLALSLFSSMLSSYAPPDRLTFPPLFSACARLCCARERCACAAAHAAAVKLGHAASDPYTCNSLVSMYAAWGAADDARRAFCAHDVVSWNALLTALVNAGEVEEAAQAFEGMRERTPVTWSIMIGGLITRRRFVDAFGMFRRAQREGVEAAPHAIVSLLGACAQTGALTQGEWIHQYATLRGVRMNDILSNAIINMYCKCGCVDKAMAFFEKIAPENAISTWNAMICGLAAHGRAKEAMGLYARLVETARLRPDHVTFVGILNACRHRGMVREAFQYFNAMVLEYGIDPGIEHYGCMVDLLGREGHVEEAEAMVRAMHVPPDTTIMTSLLSACRMHGRMDIGVRTAERVVGMDWRESVAYVLMSNAYARAGEFGEAAREREKMREKGVRKERGCSMVEVGGGVHEFMVGGRLHPHMGEICEALEGLGLHLKGGDLLEDSMMCLVGLD